jgi:hypothetical protein
MLETVPLYLLYEASILIASVVARRDAARTTVAGEGRPPEDPPSSPGAAGTPSPRRPSPSGGPGGTGALATRRPDDNPKTAQEMIDHIDPDLT